MSARVVTNVTIEEARLIKKLSEYLQCSRYALLQRYIREGLKRDVEAEEEFMESITACPHWNWQCFGEQAELIDRCPRWGSQCVSE